MMTPSPTLKPQNKTLLGSGPLGTLAYFGDANLMLDFLGERPTLSLPTPPISGRCQQLAEKWKYFPEDPCLLCGSQTTGLQQSLTPDMEAHGALSPRSLPHVTLTTNGAGAAYPWLIPPVKLGGRMRGECQGGPEPHKPRYP